MFLTKSKVCTFVDRLKNETPELCIQINMDSFQPVKGCKVGLEINVK